MATNCGVKAMPWSTAFSASSEPSVAIRMLVHIVLSSVATSLRQGAQISLSSCWRIDRNSCRRSALVSG